MGSEGMALTSRRSARDLELCTFSFRVQIICNHARKKNGKIFNIDKVQNFI
jgi:hypothetical protein